MDLYAVAVAWVAGGLAASAVVLGCWVAGAPEEVGIIIGIVVGMVVFFGAAIALDSRYRR